MIIENNNKKYFVPDEIGNDQSKSVADVFASAIPYEAYEKELRKKEIEKELEEFDYISDTFLLDWAKENNSDYLEYIKLQEALNEL